MINTKYIYKKKTHDSTFDTLISSYENWFFKVCKLKKENSINSQLKWHIYPHSQSSPYIL